MRLKSSIWVAAYLRRCQTEGIFGAVRRRGAEEAGAVFVKVAHLDGNAMLYGPAPQTVYDESRPAERLFAPASAQPVPEQSVEERLTKETVSIPTPGSSRPRTGQGGISRSGEDVRRVWGSNGATGIFEIVGRGGHCLTMAGACPKGLATRRGAGARQRGLRKAAD